MITSHNNTNVEWRCLPRAEHPPDLVVVWANSLDYVDEAVQDRPIRPCCLFGGAPPHGASVGQ